MSVTGVCRLCTSLTSYAHTRQALIITACSVELSFAFRSPIQGQVEEKTGFGCRFEIFSTRIDQAIFD